MRKSRILWALAVLPILASCASEEPGGANGDREGIKDGIYMSLTLNPSGRTGTRSSTSGPNSSNDGVEVGTDAENAVKTALIVITDRDNNLISTGVVPSEDNKGSITEGTVAGQPLYQAVAMFDKTQLADYYAAGGNGDINVFVYCNPPESLTAQISALDAGDTSWIDYAFDNSAESGRLWDASKGFTMTNVSMAPRQLPNNLREWDNYSTALKPFDLSGTNSPGTEGSVDNLANGGAINVHRMAARFDFRDGSQMEGGNGIKGTPFTYEVVKNEDGETIVNCKILAMGLYNMSKTQYYLSRVSANGRPSGANYQLLGAELPWFNGAGGNYIISTNYDAKYAEITSNFSNYFEYPFFAPNGVVADRGEGWDWAYCENVVKNPSDNYADKSYHVWRYLTENTIPGPPVHQTNGQSTGVAFKARLLPTDKLNDAGSDKWENMLYEALAYEASSIGPNKLLHHDRDLDPVLYSLSGNTLYITWDNVREAALADAGYDVTKGQNQILDRTVPLYQIVYGTGGVGVVTDDEGRPVFTDGLAQDRNSLNYLWQTWDDARTANPNSSATQTAMIAFKSAATGAGFTLYQTSQDPQTGEWGYYCYYYYWNRHNDNGQAGAMGPMEFAVVRNNVYKLAVTTLHTLGHPRIPENDPEDPDPKDPDEKSEVYITVSVDVVPWVARLNNIEF